MNIENDKERQSKKIIQKSKIFTKITGFKSIMSDASYFWNTKLDNIGDTFCCAPQSETNQINQNEPDQLPFIERPKFLEIRKNPSKRKNKDNSKNEILQKDSPVLIVKEQQKDNSTRSTIEENKSNNNRNNSNKSIIKSPIKKDSDIVPIVYSESTNEIYSQLVDPQTNRKIWLQFEDDKLLDIVNHKECRNWKKISKIFGNKTPQQCSYRYTKLMNEISKKKWSRMEDIKIIELIETKGQDWSEIRKYFPNRTPKEIEERYRVYLDPALKKSKFSAEEDQLIIKLHEIHGNNWAEITKHFKDRNLTMIKNRYYSFLRKKLIKENLTNKYNTNFNIATNNNLSQEASSLNNHENEDQSNNFYCEDSSLNYNMNIDKHSKIFSDDIYEDKSDFNDDFRFLSINNNHYSFPNDEPQLFDDTQNKFSDGNSISNNSNVQEINQNEFIAMISDFPQNFLNNLLRINTNVELIESLTNLDNFFEKLLSFYENKDLEVSNCINMLQEGVKEKVNSINSHIYVKYLKIKEDIQSVELEKINFNQETNFDLIKKSALKEIELMIHVINLLKSKLKLLNFIKVSVN